MDTTSISSGEAQTQFLQLLVTQLQNQDPLNPVEQDEFIGQLAQFSTLESLENLNASFSDQLKLQELTQGSSLLGKDVEFNIPETGQTGSGTVSALRVSEGQLLLEVEGASVPISEIQRVVAA